MQLTRVLTSDDGALIQRNVRSMQGKTMVEEGELDRFLALPKSSASSRMYTYLVSIDFTILKYYELC